MSKIMVSIGLTEKVSYHRYVEMEQADYDRLQEQLGATNHRTRERAAEEVRSYMRPEHVTHSDDIDVDIFEPAKGSMAL
jgi:hypothetical protein